MIQERAQVCRIDNATSCLKHITCGVPQGLNLGPLICLIYINDLPNCLKTFIPGAGCKEDKSHRVDNLSTFCIQPSPAMILLYEFPENRQAMPI